VDTGDEFFEKTDCGNRDRLRRPRSSQAEAQIDRKPVACTGRPESGKNIRRPADLATEEAWKELAEGRLNVARENDGDGYGAVV
jgi:hypothetical protein